jgi:hypothetical protein
LNQQIGKLDATVQLCVSDDVWPRDIKRTSRAIAVPAIDLVFKWSLTIPAEEGARKNVFSGEPAYGAENAGNIKAAILRDSMPTCITSIRRIYRYGFCRPAMLSISSKTKLTQVYSA